MKQSSTYFTIKLLSCNQFTTFTVGAFSFLNATLVLFYANKRFLSIYDNTQISSFGTDLLGFWVGIFTGFADEPGCDRHCWVSFGGGFGDNQSQNRE